MKRKRSQKIIVLYVITLLIAVSVALLIRIYFLEAYKIPTRAMFPTLDSGDLIFVAKWPIGMKFLKESDVKRGDIVVFTSSGYPRADYIKRIVALPGDTVEVQSGKLILNSETMNIGPGRSSSCGIEKTQLGHTYEVCWEPPLIESYGPEVVPKGTLFVLGDLRSSPVDTKKARTWGMVPISSLKGKAMWIWLSLEPHPIGQGMEGGWFPRFRFDRMFRRIQ